MKEIKTIVDLGQLLSLEKAIVFIFLEWSGQAHFSKKIISDWENQTKLKIPLFEINPEDSEDISKWVYDNQIHGNGYGSIVWLKNGKILDFEKNVEESSIFEIEKKTIRIMVGL